MIENEKQTRQEHVLSVARAMMGAARTAPKGKGFDFLEIVTINGDDLGRLAAAMRQLSEELGYKFFLRDAINVEESQAVVLVGTKNVAIGLNCGLCGSETCAGKPKNVPCAFNMSDLGTAVGSAAALAADMRIDTRIMYSVGKAAAHIGIMDGCHAVLGILMSCTAKSPFFDRVSHKPDAAK